MKHTFKVLFVLAALASFAGSQAQVSILAKVMGDSKISATEAAAAIIIADALGMKVDAFIKISSSKGESCSVAGPAMLISKRSGRSLDDVLRNKPKGEGWGNTAKRMGMHPGDFNKMRVKGESFDTILWINLLGGKYRVNESDFYRCRKNGLSDIEIVLAYVKCDGKASGLDRSMREVMSDRKHGKDHDDSGRGKRKGKGRGGD